MARIVHLALKVSDIDKVDDFYSKIFGFIQVRIPNLRSTTRYLSDGNIHIAVNKSRGGEPGKLEDAPCIDHFGIEVDDMAKYLAEVKKYGCEVISEPGRPVKFRAPGGIIVELVPAGSKPV